LRKYLPIFGKYFRSLLPVGAVSSAHARAADCR
jgi:hypothetical protein